MQDSFRWPTPYSNSNRECGIWIGNWENESGDNFTSIIEITIDAQPHRNIHTNPTRYKFYQTDREVFESTLEAALGSGDVPELKST